LSSNYFILFMFLFYNSLAYQIVVAFILKK